MLSRGILACASKNTWNQKSQARVLSETAGQMWNSLYKISAPGFLRKCYGLRCIIKLSTWITFSIGQVRVSCETRLVVIHFLWMVCGDQHFYYKWTNDQLIRRSCTDGLIGDLHSSTIAWGGSVLDGCHTFATNWDLHREAKFEGKSYSLCPRCALHHGEDCLN